MNKPPTGEERKHHESVYFRLVWMAEKRTESCQMDDMGWFVFCKKCLCRLRIAEKGPCVNQHGEVAEENP